MSFKERAKQEAPDQDELLDRIKYQLFWLQNAIDSEPKRNRVKNQLMKDHQELTNRILDAMKTTPERIAELLGYDSVDDLEESLDTWHMTKDVVQYFVIIYLLIYLYIKYNNIYITLNI